ncbi:hypothetical protein [Alicyclobacillus fodiniaquatilis]|uniref:Uncharacterized protein n=1 Tax=Alicyclobacillus fodiniaquatilis TaxID=1661150 RepID=A0ABW4JME2_9BACL
MRRLESALQRDDVSTCKGPHNEQLLLQPARYVDLVCVGATSPAAGQRLAVICHMQLWKSPACLGRWRPMCINSSG